MKISDRHPTTFILGEPPILRRGIITWKNPGYDQVLCVRIFMQITSDPMRSTKLLFDLKDALGDFPSGSIYLRLLVNFNEHSSFS